MATDLDFDFAGGNGANLVEPTATTKNLGFVCGSADPGIFNWLFNRLTVCVRALETNSTAASGIAKGTIV